MRMTYVRVLPSEGVWDVILNGDEAPLARFARWDDAVDYARGLAIENGDCVLEGEDRNGRIAVREEFYSDATGAVCVCSVLEQAH
jgi:hypothetical protein